MVVEQEVLREEDAGVSDRSDAQRLWQQCPFHRDPASLEPPVLRSLKCSEAVLRDR